MSADDDRPGGTSLPGFRPLPDEADPLALLEACHERLGRQLQTLERLLARQAEGGGLLVAEDDVRAAATAVLHYFNEAAGRHHRDEEQDLFPAVIESMAGSDAVCLHGIVDRLARDHRRLEGDWQRLKPGLQALADGQSARLDTTQVSGFVAAQREHLAVEDDELLPMARRLLSTAQIEAIAAAMHGRRVQR